MGSMAASSPGSLPASGVAVDIPLVANFTAGAPPDVGVKPDVLVKSNFEDTQAGRDAGMAAAGRGYSDSSAGAFLGDMPAAQPYSRPCPGTAAPFQLDDTHRGWRQICAESMASLPCTCKAAAFSNDRSALGSLNSEAGGHLLLRLQSGSAQARADGCFILVIGQPQICRQSRPYSLLRNSTSWALPRNLAGCCQTGATHALLLHRNDSPSQPAQFCFNHPKTGTRLAPADARKQKSQQALTC